MGALDFGLSIISGVLGSLVFVELLVGLDPVARLLLRCAARRLPKPQAEEMLSEWLAFNADLKSPTYKLINALSTYIQVSETARALGVQPVRSNAWVLVKAVGRGADRVLGAPFAAFDIVGRPVFELTAAAFFSWKLKDRSSFRELHALFRSMRDPVEYRLTITVSQDFRLFRDFLRTLRERSDR